MLDYNSAFPARIIVVATFISVLLLPVAAVFCEKLEQIGVVRVQSLNMRSAPHSDAPVIRVLGKDDEVRILQEDRDWLQVIFDGRIGYIYHSEKYLERYTRHRVKSNDAEADRELAMARAREIERRIKQKEKELQEVSQKQDAVSSDLEKIDRRIRKEKSELRALMEEAEETAARIRMLEQEAERLREDIRRKKEYAGRRMTALYKLYRLGGLSLLATAGSVQEVFARKASIERVLGRDEKVLAEMAEKRRHLSRVLEKLGEKREENRRLIRRYEEKISDLAAMRQERKAVLAGLEKRKSDREQSLTYLREAARRLDETIKNLEKRSDSDKVGADFQAHQGLLKMPVQGKIVSEFGRHISSESGVASYRNGIEISSGYGEPVRAVYSGRTVFADWVKGFGRVLIVSHGNGYHTVYARLQDMFSSRGDKVESGQVIATVGDSGSRKGPCLYFEIRCNGNPVDPVKWLDKG
ncbi:MAG: peptidoglycan DD-metalloendopeptidase family protein [Desulfobacteraceae bacterium]|nr:peptidoglycan DD-metalloendopeptidase family protein [Desulfobacteraceae bacterium]